MDGGQDVAPLVGDDQLDHPGRGPQAVADGAQQFVDALARQRRDGRPTPDGGRPAAWPRSVSVGLVEGQQLGHVAGADLGQDGPDRLDLRLGVGAGAVDHVDEQVRLVDHLERRAKRLDQLVRQLADEPDGVGQQHRLAAGQSRRRVRGSRVANRRSSTSTPASVRRLSSVDLPALV